MTPSNTTYGQPSAAPPSVVRDEGTSLNYSLVNLKDWLWPYQVYAVQHMVKCIDDDDGNGFVWHTTGSGKTLTSFNASTFATVRDTLLPKLLSGEGRPSDN